MANFGRTDDETTDQIGRSAPSGGGWDEDESTEVVNNADVGGFFGGRFRIDARLGAGAMGRVLTALDTETGRLVALKVLHRERSKDKNVLRRFAREAAALRAIDHRAIVGIVASGRAPDGTPWLAMEHLVGHTLKTRIVKGTPMQPAELWPILKTLAEAVAEAHARGVVHRDIKPDNIFLPEGGDPPCKILDFGLSTLSREGADKVTATGQLLGTPRYMAPELLASIGKPDHRVDVFALAVVAFEALTGKSLYSAEDLGSLFGQILEARTYSLRQFRPDLSPELEAVIRQGHARSMSDRYPSATAFATAFAQAAGIGDAARPAQAPALASLFDDVAEGDGNAPLVDPFGPPARPAPGAPAVSATGGPLPPLAHEVEPFLPTPAAPIPRQRVATAQGHGLPVPGLPARTPPQATARAEQPAATLYQPGPPASMPQPADNARTLYMAGPPPGMPPPAPGPIATMAAPQAIGSARSSGTHPLPGAHPPAAPAFAAAGAAPAAAPFGAAAFPAGPPGAAAPFGAPAAGGFGAPPASGVASVGFGAPPASGVAPGGYGAPPASSAGFGAPPGAGVAPVGYGAPPSSGVAPAGFGAPPASGVGGAPPNAGFGAPAPAYGAAGPSPGPSFGAAPAAAPGYGAAPQALGPGPAPPAFGAAPAPAFGAPPGPPAAPSSSAGAPAFSVPPAGEPRFTAPPSVTGPAAPAPAASSRMGWLLFGVAAVIVVVLAVAGAVALRWWMAQRGM